MKTLMQTLLALALVTAPMAGTAEDFGEKMESGLQAKARKLFGFEHLERSALLGDVVPRETAAAGERQLIAKGLKVEYVARNVAFRGDMITFWPDDVDYTHLILCIEGGRADLDVGPLPGLDGQNPSLQRVNVATGKVETILSGMDRCDGIRTTQWGTVLATEETGDGQAYEILDPLGTTGHWVADRATGDIRDGIGSPDPSKTVAKRDALATQAWEGLDTLDNGVVIGGDELRNGQDRDGGAVFRFVPSQPFECKGSPVRPGQVCGNPIGDLSESPLVAGRNYALFTGCGGTSDYGQGCEYGDGGRWVGVGASTAREDANANGATGYCRPEDLHVDPGHGVFDGGEGIRWCWNNTCGGADGEALCAFEGTEALSAYQEKVVDIGGDAGEVAFLSLDGDALAMVDVQRFVENDAEMQSQDNLEIQLYTGNTYLVEDYNELEDGGTGGDVWACLPDGADRDERSDGCVRLLSVADVDAEPTGFIFDGTGQVAYYVIQHGSQAESLFDFETHPACDDGGCNGFTDDLIRISGFRLKGGKGEK